MNSVNKRLDVLASLSDLLLDLFYVVKIRLNGKILIDEYILQ